MFISPRVVYADLARTYKNLSFDYGDIVEWCMQVETEHICDVDIMWKFRYVVKIKNGRIILPNNVYRVLSVKLLNGGHIKYPALSSVYIHGLKKYENKIVSVVFLGVPIDENCEPLIAASHRTACQQFCMINIKRPKALDDINEFKMLESMEEKFGNMVTAAKQGFSEWTEDDIRRLALHNYNLVFQEVYAKWHNYNYMGVDRNIDRKGKITLIADENILSEKEKVYDSDITDTVLVNAMDRVTIIE